MKKILASLLIVLALSGCGSSELAPEDQVQLDDFDTTNENSKATGGTTVVNNVVVPLLPSAAPLQNMGVMATFLTDESVEDVKAWYDEKMGDNGYTFIAEWRVLDTSNQKEYVKDGGTVQVSVGLEKKSGKTLLVILPFKGKVK